MHDLLANWFDVDYVHDIPGVLYEFWISNDYYVVYAHKDIAATLTDAARHIVQRNTRRDRDNDCFSLATVDQAEFNNVDYLQQMDIARLFALMSHRRQSDGASWLDRWSNDVGFCNLLLEKEKS